MHFNCLKPKKHWGDFLYPDLNLCDLYTKIDNHTFLTLIVYLPSAFVT